MRLFALALLVLALTACTPVAGDPYSLRAQADGAIAATQAAQQAQGTQAAIRDLAAQNEAQQAIAILQAQAQATQAAQAAQMTQLAIEAIQVQGTQAAQQATATQYAHNGAVIATSTAQVIQATQQAQLVAAEVNKNEMIAGLLVAVAIVFVAFAGFVLRASKDVILALMQSVAQQIRARSMLRETQAGVMVFIAMGSGPTSAGVYVPSNQVLEYARLVSRTPAPDQVVDYDPDSRDKTPAVYWPIQHLLKTTIASKGKYQPNQLASKNEARMGGSGWDRAVNALEAAGVRLDRQNGVGTFVVDERYPTVDKLWDALISYELPLPTDG